jgi:hypothetical protein
MASDPATVSQVQERLTLILTQRAPRLNVAAVDRTLDLEQRVEAQDRFHGDRRNRLSLIAV